MNYLVRYLIEDDQGVLQQLGPEESFDEHPLLGFGSTVFVEYAVYRVGSMPLIKQMKTGDMLYEVLLVSEEEYKRTFASGRVPVASIEPGFSPNVDREWASRERGV